MTVTDVVLRMLLYVQDDPESWCLCLAQIRSLPEVQR